jgi:hypothetical protein
MKILLAGLIIALFTVSAIAAKILGIATVIAFVLALIGLFDVQMSTAINLLLLTVGAGTFAIILMAIGKVLAFR